MLGMRGHRDLTGASDRQFRRGAVMGLTIAEAFILISFILLLLLGAWQVQSDEEKAQLHRISQLSEREIADVATLVDHKQLDAVTRLVSAGLDFRRGEGIPDSAKKWRLIDSDELRRMVDAASDLPPDLQHDLADLVEIKDPKGLAEILARTRRAPKDAELQQQLAGIGARIGAAERDKAKMVDDLRATLGEKISDIGGYIDANGSIVFPETVLFDVGSDEIKAKMLQFLETTCEPWMRVMMRSPAPVASAQIEGHASSEWQHDTPLDLAYLKNLDLSQRRSQAVLNKCLDIVQDPDVRRWAHRHLAAVGYSSAHPVMVGGAEDRERSRRVVFSVEFDRERLLKQIQRDVSRGLAPGPAPSEGQLVGQITHVRDGDTIEVAGRAIRLNGVTCDEIGTPLGDKATDAVRRRFSGKMVTCTLNGDVTYDREVGRCSFRDGRDLGSILISEGLCGRCPRYDPQGSYIDKQKLAGPWRGEFPPYCGP